MDQLEADSSKSQSLVARMSLIQLFSREVGLRSATGSIAETATADIFRIDYEIASLCALAVLWVFACIAVDPRGNFPLNDDWAFGHAVKVLVQTGHFMLPNGTSADLMTQVFWGALFCLPFGFSFTALRISTLTLGLVGVFAMYGLVREAGGSRRLALLGALTLAANPFYFGLANSFMSDVPFVALLLVALYLFIRGIRLNSAAYIAAAVAVASANILVRQFAVLELVAFGIGYTLRYGLSRKNVLIALVPVAAGTGLHFEFQHWMLSTGRIANFDHAATKLMPLSAMAVAKSIVVCVAGGLPYVGAMTASFLLVLLGPAFLQLSSHRRVRFLFWFFAVAIALAEVNLFCGTTLPNIGNVINLLGLGPFDLLTSRSLHHWLPPWLKAFWLATNVIGTLAGVAVTVVIGVAGWVSATSLRRHESRSRAWLPALLCSLLAGYGLLILLLGTTTETWDRYFLPFAPLVCLIALCAVGNTRAHPGVEALSVVMLLGMAAFSIGATHDFLAFNRARWRASDALLASGVSPLKIDGGYEFHGWYTLDEYHWNAKREYALAVTPMPNYSVVKSYKFDRWLTLASGEVLVLRRKTVTFNAFPK